MIATACPGCGSGTDLPNFFLASAELPNWPASVEKESPATARERRRGKRLAPSTTQSSGRTTMDDPLSSASTGGWIGAERERAFGTGV